MISDFFKGRALAFRYAFSGLAELWRNEKNTRIHLFFTILAVFLGLLLKISLQEFAVIVLTIGSVWTAEAFNSAVERTVDLVTLEKRPLAKAGKDLAAGAVLISAIASVVIGVMIFLPKIIASLLY